MLTAPALAISCHHLQQCTPLRLFLSLSISLSRHLHLCQEIGTREGPPTRLLGRGEEGGKEKKTHFIAAEMELRVVFLKFAPRSTRQVERRQEHPCNLVADMSQVRPAHTQMWYQAKWVYTNTQIPLHTPMRTHSYLMCGMARPRPHGSFSRAARTSEAGAEKRQ